MFQMFVSVFVFISLSYLFITFVISILKLKYRSKIQLHDDLAPVSILKPVKGVDGGLEENLRSFFELEYPSYEILFGVADKDDPAVPVIEKVRSENTHIKSRLVFCPDSGFLNPKVNILYHLEKFTSNEYILISDSNVRVHSDYLTDMLKEMSGKGVGLVTSSLLGRRASSLSAAMENLHLNTYVAMNVFTVPLLFNRNIAIGKSMLFSKKLLDEIGGFEGLGNVLAEDYILGKKISELGFKVKTTVDNIENVNINWSFKHFSNRHIRWAQLRRNLSLVDYTAELISMPVPVMAAFALFIQSSFIIDMFLFVSLFKFLLDFSFARTFGDKSHLLTYLMLPFKDLFLGFFWILGLFKRTVNWRGNLFLIAQGTRLFPKSSYRRRVPVANPVLNQPQETIDLEPDYLNY